MKKQIYVVKRYFYTTVFLITVMSLTFVAMPGANYIENGWKQRVFLVAIGAIFWISLIGGYTFWFMAQKAYKKLLYKTDEVTREKNNETSKWFKLFANTYATIADAMLIATIVAIIAITIFGRGDGFLPYIVLAILVFSINMHFIFNGNLYKFITNNVRREKNAKECKE